jgi:hypothetical protein
MVTTTSLGVTCSARQSGPDRCLQPNVARRTTDGKSKRFLRGPSQGLRIPIVHAVQEYAMHAFPPPLSLPPVPEPKALEPESQEPECTPLPRTPPALSQRHKGQSLQSTTPSTLSARCLALTVACAHGAGLGSAWTTQVSARARGVSFGTGRAAHVFGAGAGLGE